MHPFENIPGLDASLLSCHSDSDPTFIVRRKAHKKKTRQVQTGGKVRDCSAILPYLESQTGFMKKLVAKNQKSLH